MYCNILASRLFLLLSDKNGTRQGEPLKPFYSQILDFLLQKWYHYIKIEWYHLGGAIFG